jgi:type II secretory pathway pseudopilin PulG
VTSVHESRTLRAFSLVEVLVAALVMAALGFSVYDAMVSTTRGIQVDRASEARRQITLDLLERFAQPYSDVHYLFPRGDAPRGPVTRELDLDQAMDAVAIPTADRPLLKSILSSGSIRGFTVVWSRGLTVGGGDKLRLRKDRIWIHPVFTRVVPGAQSGSFRVFAVRES